LPAPNPLETDSDKADALYRQASEAGKAGDWQKTYELLIEAVRLKQSHDILGNLGTAEHHLKRYRDAAEHFTASLKLYPVNGRPEGKAFSQTLLDEARAEVGTLALKITPVTARVRVNDREYAAADRDAVFVDPGEATVEVGGLPGYESLRKTVKVEKGREQTVTMELGLLGGGAEKPSWAVIGVGAGLAAVALGAGFGLVGAAQSTQDAIDAKRRILENTVKGGPCPKQPTSGICAEALTAKSQHDAFAGAALGLFAGAGVLAAVTAGYALWPRSNKVKAGVAVGPQGGGLVVTGAF
jgi:tetratricopeptide (TPR) repeat protein